MSGAYKYGLVKYSVMCTPISGPILHLKSNQILYF